MNMDWITHYKDVLLRSVPDKYKKHIDEFISFVANVASKAKFNTRFLTAISEKPNVIRAKLNAFYAYLVFRGYVTSYELMREKVIAGAGSIYTWINVYKMVFRTCIRRI